MKLALCLLSSVLCLLLTSCATVPPGTTVTVARPDRPAVSFATGKDVQSTAAAASLAAAAYWLNLHTTPAVSAK